MTNNMTRKLCLAAFVLTVGGCGGGGGESDRSSEQQIPLDNTIATEVTTTSEVADGATVSEGMDGLVSPEETESTETSDGIASPVQPVSSGLMDAYVKNPLVAAIPTELTGNTSIAVGSFVANPLIH